jgi:HD superfamily phosphodiesterase
MDYPNAIIEDLMEEFRSAIGVDLEKYRNHVYRVFLNCILQDSNTGNVEKYAIAAVFHDIGIWTDHTIDYLSPSIAQARKYLAANGKILLPMKSPR